jgi:hypothetical protein
MSMKHCTGNFQRLVAVVGIAFLLGGCVPALEEVKSAKDLQPNEVLLVGKVELVPRLQKFEQQNLKGIGTGKFKGHFGLIFAAQKPTYKKGSESGTTYKQMDNYALVEPGKTFYVRYPKGKPVYYLGGLIYLSSDGGSLDSLKLPGGLSYVPGKSARAIYLGTIRYYRDDYNAITKVRLINQVNEAVRDLRKETGGNIPVQVVKPHKFRMRALDF